MHLTLGPITIEIKGITDKDIPINSRIFIDNDKKAANISYTFEFVDKLPGNTEGWQPIFKRGDIEVYQKGDLEMRRLGIKDVPNKPYALVQETTPNKVIIYFIEERKKELQIDTIFISCLTLERYLAQCKAIILHCAFLAYNKYAILFSGPSGIGKSTHSDLWCNYIADTKVINGDRCLIYRNNKGEYVASGWPVCGSSQKCIREEYPLRHIVFLQQNKENKIVAATPMQLFKQLCTQTTINWWNRKSAQTILDELQTLMQETSITNYACNISSEATEVLRKYIDTH